MAVLPRLGIKFHPVSPTITFIRVMSLGPGAAMDVDVEVVFVPRKEDVFEIRRRIQVSVMATGDTADVMPVPSVNAEIMDTATLATLFDRIELIGTIRDVTDAPHDVHDVLPDLSEWLDIRKEAILSWSHPNFERRLAKELAEQLDKTSLGKIAKGIDQLRAELRQHRDDDP